MRVLMVNHPGTLKFRGGDLTQMRKTAEALKAHGVTVVESFDPEPDARGFDLAHVFNLRTIHATPRQVKSLKKAGVPVVLSPIYLNVAYTLWANRAVPNVFSRARPTEEIQRLLELLRNRALKVKGSTGELLTAQAENRPDPNYDHYQREVLKNVDHLLPNSYLEMDRLVKTLRVYDVPFTVVPYACDPAVFGEPDPTPFRKKHGLDKFVLQVGRIEASKNQLMLAYALRELDLPLVLIGGTLQPKYLQAVQSFGPRNLVVIPHMPQEELRSAYAAARVHALPSWMETCGLVTMEAAMAGANTVSSIAGYELEYYRDLTYYCDPADHRSISKAVVRAYDNYDRDADRRQDLRALIRREYTWERAGELTFRAYESVLAKK